MTERMHMPARCENIPQFLEFVSRCSAGAGFAADRGDRIRLAAEEVLVNIISNAYPDKGGDVVVACSVQDDYFKVAITDQGVPFDPLTVPEPEVRCRLAERPIGGLGIHLVRQLTDDMKYWREEGSNHLELLFRLSSPV